MDKEDKQVVGIVLIFLGILAIVFGYILFEDADNYLDPRHPHYDPMGDITEGEIGAFMEGFLGLGCFLLGMIFLSIGIFLICKIV
jgi:hypothetical protein